MLRSLLDFSQSLAGNSRCLTYLRRELVRQLGLVLPGAGGHLALEPANAEDPIADAFGTAPKLDKAALIELLDAGRSAPGAEAIIMPVKDHWKQAFPPGTRCIAATPIQNATRCLGRIVAGFPTIEAAQSALSLMNAVGTLAGVHVANAQENEALATKARYVAEHDTLVTGLPNRQLLRDRARVTMNDGAPALLFLDLDGFNEINRRCGYAAGDAALEEVAQRWRQIVEREHPGATLARMGGDEFAVLLPSEEAAAVEALAAALLTALHEPLHSTGQPWLLRASAGISRASATENTVELLLRRAEEAMYQAKEAGGAQYAWASHTATPAEERSANG